MNTDRLLRLAAFLETLPPERFNYGQWVGDDWAGKPDLSCGTAACALGWAMSLPDMGVPPAKRYLTSSGRAKAVWEYDDGTDREPLDVAQVAFDLVRHDAKFLFIPGHTPQSGKPQEDAEPQEVAAHIRKFVEAGGIYVV